MWRTLGVAFLLSVVLVSSANSQTQGQPPQITAINPFFAVVPASNTPLTVTGTNFATTLPGSGGCVSTIYFGQDALATTFVNTQTLVATIPAALLTTQGFAYNLVGVVVVNTGSAACAGTSSTFYFYIIPALTGSCSNLPSGVRGTPYSGSLGASGGLPPYTWALLSGSLPGLTLSSSGAFSGTPTAAGTFPFTAQVSDSGQIAQAAGPFGQTTTFSCSITISPPPVTAGCSNLPAGTVGAAYSAALAASGGTPPFTWTLASGSIPGLTLNPAGAFSGTPTTAGTYPFTARVIDSAGQTASVSCSITINPAPLVAACSNLPAGTVGATYSAALSASGGTPPFTWTLTSGSIPGLTLNAAGTFSGTPTTPGTYPFTARVTDSGQQTTTVSCSITIRLPLAAACSNLPAGIVGAAYSATLSATGGAAPSTWTLTSGSIPGLTLNAAGTFSGIPTTAGTYPFTAQVTDSAQQTATVSCSITIRLALAAACSNLPSGSVGAAYLGSLSATGGVAPYTWSLVSGGIPGLTLNSAGTFSGTPTAQGVYSFTAQVNDSGGQTTTVSCSITISLPPLAAACTNLPAGTVGTPYAGSLSVSGGTGPYKWSLASASIPGLTLSSTGTFSGTPTTSGTFSFTAQVSDSAGATTTLSCSLAIKPVLLTATCSNLPAGILGTAYTGTLAASGGTPPYTWSLVSQGVPGLNLQSSGAFVGTPGTVGNFPFTVQITDAGSGAFQQTATVSCSITVKAAGPAASCSNLPAATVGAAYSASLLATGGTPPYTWSLASGSIPGLTLGPAGTFTGTPTTPGNYPFSAQVTDSAQQTATVSCSVTVKPAPLAAACSNLPAATLGAPYSSSLSATGGTPPYTWSLASGTIPGLTLSSAGSFSGTPTTAGTYPFSAQVTDSAQQTATVSCSLTVQSATVSASCSRLPAATVGAAYSGALSAAGGTPPYTWALVSGSIPGLAFDPTGTFSGTPTTAGTYPFTAQVTDAAKQTATASCSITVQPEPLTAACSLAAGTVATPYSASLTASGGAPPYAWSLTSTAVPGLTLNSSGTLSGTPTAANTYNLAARVTDSASGSNQQSATTSCSLTIRALALPVITITGSTPSAPTDQPSIGLTLGGATPVPLNGTLTLSFRPNAAGVNSTYIDPAVKFSSGGTTLNFTVPANATTVTLPANTAIVQGTVAGDVVITISSLTANGVSVLTQPAPTRAITVARMAPVITANSVRIVNATATGFSVELSAYSTPRDITNATFTFNAATGTTIQGATLTKDLRDVFTSWYSDPNGQANGSAFTLSVPFTLTGDANALQSVTVTLTNSVGTSNAVTGGR